MKSALDSSVIVAAIDGEDPDLSACRQLVLSTKFSVHAHSGAMAALGNSTNNMPSAHYLNAGTSFLTSGSRLHSITRYGRPLEALVSA
ncbi:MAG TPA: hypothetical protein DCE44_05425 [Verrucomicrobiales bacterium]|nr:hypothetical protein [Verrucomicrobiales bacterium]